MTRRTERSRRRPGLGPKGAVVLAGLLAVLAGWIYVSRRGMSAEAKPDEAVGVLQHIPPGAMLVAVVDVTALRATALGQQLLGEGSAVAGLGEVRAICGADPMDQFTQMALAVPDVGLDAGFGVFAIGSFKAEDILGCAEKFYGKSGGKPVRVPSGRFSVLRDASLKWSAEIAAADGGPALLAEPSYVRAAVGTTSANSVLSDKAHAALRDLVPAGQLVATGVLSVEHRRTLIEELRAQNQIDSPFRAVTGGALSVQLGAALSIVAALRCDSDAACVRVSDHLRRAAQEESASPVAKAVGLDTVLQKIVIEVRGSAVLARVEMPAQEALSLIRRVLVLRKLVESDDLTPPAPVPALPPSTPAPDAGVIPPDAGMRIETRPLPSSTPSTSGSGTP